MLRQILGRVPPVYRAVNTARGYRIDRANRQIPFELLGSWYGAWPLPSGLITKQSVIYSFGIGEDITFDLEVIRRTGAKIFAFDPTPIAMGWLGQQDVPEEFLFTPVGLAEFDGMARFSDPSDAHSFSRNTDQAASGIERKVARLTTLMSANGHRHLDFLKMDIEGFEYAVIDDMLACQIYPRVLAVEFHHKSYGIPPKRTALTVAALKRAGYDIFWVSDLGREYGFVLS